MSKRIEVSEEILYNVTKRNQVKQEYTSATTVQNLYLLNVKTAEKTLQFGNKKCQSQS